MENKIQQNKKEKIAAVVVTYNRKELLKECLNALLNQTYPLDSIIIMDNASTDGTEEMLKKEYLDNPIFDYVNLGENLGGAGGFHYGIKRAYEKGFNWAWVMDDDVIAKENAIEKYLKYKKISFFIQGRRENKDGTILKWGYIFNPVNGRRESIDEDIVFKKGNYTNVNVACFEGAFINKKVVEKIGFPDKQFFIAEDDTFYGYKVSKYFNIIYIKEVTLKRNRKINYKKFMRRKFFLQSPLSLYYITRNKYLLEKKVKEVESKDIDHRKEIFKFLTEVVIEILLIQRNKIELLKALYFGARDGFNGNYEPRKFFELKI